MVVRKHHQLLLDLPLDFELLLVPNGCSDESESICQKLAEQLPHVRSVDCHGVGWGCAIHAGLREAKGDLLCYASSARISSKDLFEHLRFAIKSPNSVVKARRLSQDTGLRAAGSSLYNSVCRTLFGFSIRDVNGTPKTFPKNFFRLLELSEDGYLVDVEFNLICKQNNYPVVELPIVSTERHGGRSTTSLKTALGLFAGLFAYWCKVRTRPAKSLWQRTRLDRFRAVGGELIPLAGRFSLTPVVQSRRTSLDQSIHNHRRLP